MVNPKTKKKNKYNELVKDYEKYDGRLIKPYKRSLEGQKKTERDYGKRG